MRLYQATYRDKDGERKRGRKWRVRFSIDGIRNDEPTGLTDKRAAQMRAGEIVKAAQMRAGGIETFEATREASLPELVEEFRKELVGRGRTDRHARETAAKLLRCFAGLGTIAACTPERLRKVLRQLGERQHPTTVSRYRAALGVFFGWLVREERWHQNPVEHVQAPKATHVSRNRRALDDGELDALLLAAPRNRAITYLFAATTGLRRKELEALTWDHLDLDGDSPTVTLRPEETKGGKSTGEWAVLPLPHQTVQALNEVLTCCKVAISAKSPVKSSNRKGFGGGC